MPDSSITFSNIQTIYLIKTNITMKKNIRLTEKQLHKVIKEAASKILKEESEEDNYQYVIDSLYNGNFYELEKTWSNLDERDRREICRNIAESNSPEKAIEFLTDLAVER